jgi:hypothetical protein
MRTGPALLKENREMTITRVRMTGRPTLPYRPTRLPKGIRGTLSREAKAELEAEIENFCQYILQIKSRLDFDVSARGWAYILEQDGIITKGEFDAAQGLINKCRKAGQLPLDICTEDETRRPDNLEGIDDTTPEEEAEWIIHNMLKRSDYYRPISFWEKQEYYIEMWVEKVDLKSLFAPVTEEYCVPMRNMKGWSDINSRADTMKRFRDWEGRGKQCVLLYCGDHDPVGLHISEQILKNLQDLQGATGWDPSNLIIDRFGLNYEFIEANNLTWIDNLETGSGRELEYGHGDFYKRHVQDYIEKYGRRKLEANALVVRPEAGRQLCREAIERYLNLDVISEWQARLDEERAAVRTALFAMLKDRDWETE